MKNVSILLATFLLLVSLSFTACKPDPDPIPPASKSGIFQLEFVVKWGASDLVLNQNYLGPDGRNYKIYTLKYYVSRLALLTPTDSVVNVKDIALVDMYYPSSQMIADSIPPGAYTGLRFNIGLDYDQNHSNPSSYAVAHPMSSTKGMYWTWSSQYIFSKLEGYADTTGGNPAINFLYHCGTDSLMRSLEFRNLNLVIGESETKKQTLVLDLQKLFWGVHDTIDVNVDPTSQTTNDPGLASRVVNLLAAAIRS